MLEKSKIKSFIEDLELELENVKNDSKLQGLLQTAIAAGKKCDSYYTSSNARSFEDAVEECEEELGRKIITHDVYEPDDADEVDELIEEYKATLRSVENVYSDEKSRLKGLAGKEGEGFYKSCTDAIKKVINALEAYKSEPNRKNAKRVSMTENAYRKIADNYLSLYNEDKPTAKGIWGKIRSSAVDLDKKKAVKNMGGCLRWAFYLFAAALIVDQFLTVSPFIAAFVSVGTTIGIAGCGLGLIYNGGKYIINKAIKGKELVVKGKDYVVGKDPIAIKRKLAKALEKNRGKGKDAVAIPRKSEKPAIEAAKKNREEFFAKLEQLEKEMFFEDNGRILLNYQKYKEYKELIAKKVEYSVTDENLSKDGIATKLALLASLYEKFNVIPRDLNKITAEMDPNVIEDCIRLFDRFLSTEFVVDGRALSHDEKLNFIGVDVYNTMKVAIPHKFTNIIDKIGASCTCTQSEYYEASNLFEKLTAEQKRRFASRCEFFEKLSELYNLGDFLDVSEEDMLLLSEDELKNFDKYGMQIIEFFMSNEDGEKLINSVIPNAAVKFEKFNGVLVKKGIVAGKPAEDKKAGKKEPIIIEREEVVGRNFVVKIDLPLVMDKIGDVIDECIAFNAVQLINGEKTLYLAGTPLKAGESQIKLLDRNGDEVVRVILHSKVLERKPVHTNPHERENEQAGMEQGGEAKPVEEKPTEQAKPKTKRKKSVRDTLPRVQADYSTFKSEQLAEVYRSALKEMEIAHDDMDSIEFRRGLSKALKIFDYASKNSLMAMFNADDVKKVKEFYDEYKTYVSGKIK